MEGTLGVARVRVPFARSRSRQPLTRAGAFSAARLVDSFARALVTAWAPRHVVSTTRLARVYDNGCSGRIGWGKSIEASGRFGGGRKRDRKARGPWPMTAQWASLSRVTSSDQQLACLCVSVGVWSASWCAHGSFRLQKSIGPHVALSHAANSPDAQDLARTKCA